MVGGKLEGGQIVIADSRMGLYVPQGWIHLVYTLRGGYLTSYTYTCAPQIDKFIMFASLELAVLEKGEVGEYTPTLQFLFTAISDELNSNDRDKLWTTLGQWLRVVERMDAGLMEQKHRYPPIMREHINGLLRGLERERKLDLGRDCPCGMPRSGADIFQHLAIHKPQF